MGPRQVHSTITRSIEQETLSHRPHVPDFIDTPLVNEPSTVQQSSDGWAVDLRACQGGLRAQDWVALGRYRPRAPTDPYVLALEHTVLQLMASLRV